MTIRPDVPQEPVYAKAHAESPLLQIQEARKTIAMVVKALNRWPTNKDTGPVTWGRAADLNRVADRLLELARDRGIDVPGRRRS